ncbi:hypothetical protein CRG98_012590 [Punica granatum]|uniref:Uncharacterized protein n=1 Tax=Punica granatum TaxID=22663 RepID=A0A2I0KEW5_PUNGR|nr:hypothetical protein CRG98_012590 [Punica granatum]
MVGRKNGSHPTAFWRHILQSSSVKSGVHRASEYSGYDSVKLVLFTANLLLANPLVAFGNRASSVTFSNLLKLVAVASEMFTSYFQAYVSYLMVEKIGSYLRIPSLALEMDAGFALSRAQISAAEEEPVHLLCCALPCLGGGKPSEVVDRVFGIQSREQVVDVLVKAWAHLQIKSSS